LYHIKYDMISDIIYHNKSGEWEMYSGIRVLSDEPTVSAG